MGRGFRRGLGRGLGREGVGEGFEGVYGLRRFGSERGRGERRGGERRGRERGKRRACARGGCERGTRGSGKRGGWVGFKGARAWSSDRPAAMAARPSGLGRYAPAPSSQRKKRCGEGVGGGGG